jgi:hypothetical protein
MKVRGERRCRECGERWSYYETGSVECPACGSLRSVGTESQRRLHTAGTATLDLTADRTALNDGQPLREVAAGVEDTCAAYVRGVGFIDADRLQPLDDTFLAALELRYVAAEVARRLEVTEDEEYHFLALLRGGDEGDRPPAEAVPRSFQQARGLAYATAVTEYRSDLRAYLNEHPDPLVGDVLAPLGEHLKRVKALDGDVTPGAAEALVRVVREVARYLIEDDEGALATARQRLDTLSDV